MNKLSFKAATGMLLLSLFILSCTRQDKGQGKEDVQTFDLRRIAARHPKTSLAHSDVFGRQALKIDPEEGHEGIVIWEKGDRPVWSKANYLVFELFEDNEFSGVVNIEFYREAKDSTTEKIVLQSGEISGSQKDSPWISSLMGVLPRLKTQVVFPLSFLDAQRLFVPRSPRQLKGTVSGDRLDPADIVKAVLRFGPYSEPYFRAQYELASVCLVDSVPEAYPPLPQPVVDRFGQWKDKQWSDKIKDESDLIGRNLALEKELEQITAPAGRSRYGGWEGKRFRATGYFRTQHDGTRWWLVDPDGYAFLSTGVDCIGYSSSGPVNGVEDLFEWLPDGADSAAFAEAMPRFGRAKNMDFYVANLIRVYGEDWKDKWYGVTKGLMNKFRFNTVGNWSNIDFAKRSRIPYVLPLNRFPSTEVSLYRDFPDVFSEEYRKNAVTFAEQLSGYRDDPYLVGYFLRNEPEWAFGYHNLAYEMFAVDSPSATKDEFVRRIAEKYGRDIQAFNSAWKLELSAFDDLKSRTFKDYPSETARKDFHEFSLVMVGQYVDVPCDEVEKVDRNHLNLGMRYAWLSSELLYRAGERFDVFSINGYGINPPPTGEIARISGKPVMIGEFHHGAVDRALPATGIIGVLNQDDRAAAFRNYIEQGFARPELVGMHYFQWIDQPYYGRFDGENYNIGIVTQGNLPYRELTEAATLANERIYEVATGAVEPFKADVTAIPPIHY
jgi:hypothetical protein